MKKLGSRKNWYLIIMIAVVLLTTAWAPLHTMAAVISDLPPFPIPLPDLPPFPVPPPPALPNFPSPPGSPTSTSPEPYLKGARIMLQVTGQAVEGQSQIEANRAMWQTYAWEEMYTVVQWQDEVKAWHDVMGWRGALDEVEDYVGQKTWWFSEDHFGTGAFRWLVYDHVGGKLLTMSGLFTLPTLANDTLYVKVTLSP